MIKIIWSLIFFLNIKNFWRNSRVREYDLLGNLHFRLRTQTAILILCRIHANFQNYNDESPGLRFIKNQKVITSFSSFTTLFINFLLLHAIDLKQFGIGLFKFTFSKRKNSFLSFFKTFLIFGNFFEHFPKLL